MKFKNFFALLVVAGIISSGISLTVEAQEPTTKSDAAIPPVDPFIGHFTWYGADYDEKSQNVEIVKDKATYKFYVLKGSGWSADRDSTPLYEFIPKSNGVLKDERYGTLTLGNMSFGKENKVILRTDIIYRMTGYLISRPS